MYLLPRRRLGFGIAPLHLFLKPKSKKFNYGTELNAIVIEHGISDLAAVTETNSSAVIENILIEKVMPDNERARNYYAAILFGEKYLAGSDHSIKYDVREALKDIFSEESAGGYFKAAHEGSGKCLVEYAYSILQERVIVLGGDPDGWGHYGVHDGWDSICRRLEHIEEESSDIANDDNISKAVKMARQCERFLNNDPNFPLSEAVLILLQCWEHVGDSAHTWRFMSSIMETSQDWSSTPEERLEFKDVCQSAFSEWDTFDACREEAENQKRLAAELISYDMKDGAVVTVPRGWIVVNPENALESSRAGVIEVMNGEAFGAPHFLFFAEDRNPKAFTEEERLALYQKTISVWPRFKEIINAQVELEYGPDGGVLNQKEWVLAPAIGIFNIYDEGKYPYGKHPYGAHIKRREGGIE